MNWRARRKLYYTLIALFPLVVIAGVIYYSTFFPEPTCFDGEQNGTETGIDCGGPCDKICQSNTASVSVRWSKSFPVSGDIYNTAAWIQNPNITLQAESVPYRFRLFDQDGLLIAERRGQMRIPPQPTTIAFEAGVDTDGRTVARTEFDFIERPFWEETDLSPAQFPISNKTLTGATSSSPRLTFDITNQSVQDYSNMEVSTVVFDGLNNPVHVSRTKIGRFPGQSTQTGVFTWREPFPTRTVSCVVPSNIVLMIDRSGSMNDQGQNPPQPFSSVKQAATDFARLLGDSAQSGLVSFATESSINQTLSSDHDQTLQAIQSMYIRPEDETGFTNLGSAVISAQDLLNSSADSRRSNVMIILTDGKANAPEDPGGEVYARQQINTVKNNDVTVYTIGLGDSVNQTFLREIATEPSSYYQAADRQALAGIYDEIHERLCQQAPFITEIIPTHYQSAQ